MRLGGQSEQVGERCPVGVVVGILAAVYDLGMQEGYEGKKQHKVCLWWEVSHRDTKGVRFTLPDMVTNSSSELSTLTQRVGALMGRAPTEEEMDVGYDTDPLIGKCCLLQIDPPRKPGGWPFVKNVMPCPAGMSGINRVEGKYGPGDPTPKFVEKMLDKSLDDEAPAQASEADAALDKSIPF